MPSSRSLALAGLASALTWTGAARAAPTASGFDVERLYLSPPGGGWFTGNSLDTRGALGGVLAASTGYAHDPLRVGSGPEALSVVGDDAFVDFAFALTYDRLRLYGNLDAPLAISGASGTAGGYAFQAPSVGLGQTPDAFSDARVGLDARLFGGPRSPFRLGASAELIVPVGNQPDYDGDETYRAMLRALTAGDVGSWTYTAQLGVHIRPLDEGATPGGPRGSELLFGATVGPRVPVWRGAVLVAGPELFGETAFRDFFGGGATGLEGLMSARVEGTAEDGPAVRVKVGAGGGLDPEFGAPEWRVVVGLELFTRSADRDGDGVPDSGDACPDVPGRGSKDPRTNGCPAVPPL